MCDDPHMKGLRGQKIDWSRIDGGWYNMVKDDDAHLHVNVRLTAPLPEEFPDRQLITGLRILSEGHSLVIEVNNPYDIDTNGCPRGVSPCLADGRLRAIVDGEVVEDLLRFSRDGIVFSASNLPAECRQFRGDKIWARMYEEMLQGTRELAPEEQLEDWILRFDDMAAPEWCTQYIKQHSIADLQSIYAVFKIVTFIVTVRLNVVTNYQGGVDLDWDGHLLPVLEFWQMDVGLHGLSLENE